VVVCNGCDPPREVPAHEAKKRGRYYYCPHCKERIDFSESEKEIPIEIWYICDECLKKADTRKRHLEKIPDKEDFEILSKIADMKIPYRYPDNEFIWNSRINVSKGTRVCDLFTKRNLIALSTIYSEIEKLTGDLKEIMQFVFTSSVAQASKLIPIVHGGRECKSWTIRGYWVPPRHFEINAWNCFENRFDKVLRGKKQSNELVGEKVREAEGMDDVLNGDNFIVLTQSATDMKNIPSHSVDYVFTDPPYGDAVPYLELDFMWSAWLGFKPDFEEEIIISDSPVRKKNFDDYYRLLIQSFKEIFRILKPDKWMTVTFHSTDIHIYNSILRAVIFAGFELDKIVFQPPARASAKSLLHPYGSALGDYYIRFKKPLIQRKLFTGKEVDKATFQNIVVETVKKIIAERGEPTTYTDILKGIYVQLDKHGYLFVSKPEDIRKIIREREGKDLVFIERQGWWFKDPSKYWLHITPLQDRVETTIVQTLKRGYKVSFDEILQEIFKTFQNALTPNPPSITAILQEYAVRTKDGKWRISPKVNQQGEPLSSLSVDKLTIAQPPQVLDHLKMIDVLWIKNKKIKYTFEVENTTSITSAITRGSYIPKDDVKRFIVIPEEREILMYKKINAPILKDRIEEYKWSFVFYKDLIDFYEENTKKKKIDAKDVESLGRKLIPKEIKQLSLSNYTLL